MKVLLIDDCALSRAGIRRVLDDVEDIDVVGETDTSDHAVRLARSVQPDVVLMDVNPPYVGVLDCTQKFLRQLSTVRLIVLTPEADVVIPARLIRAGVAGYLTKHCSVEELVGALRRVHAGGRHISDTLARRLAMTHLSGESHASPFETLSHRELQIMLLVTQGVGIAEVSRRLCLSQKTVNTYRNRVMDKLGVRTEVALMHLALRHGMIDIASCG